MALLSILEISKRLMFKKAVYEKALNFFELRKKVIKLLVVVFFDTVHLLAHSGQLYDLVLNLILELAYLPLQILHGKFFQHHDVVVPVLSQQALEADRAEIVLAEGFYVFR